MKSTFLISIMLLFGTMQDDSSIAGQWKLAENNTEIEMVFDGDTFKGTVVKSDAEKAIGEEILQDFKKDGDVWKGKFYAVRRDRLLDATITEKDNDNLEIEVKAGPKTRTLELTRVK